MAWSAATWLAMVLAGVGLAYGAITYVPAVGDALVARFAQRASLDGEGEGEWERVRTRVLRRRRGAALGGVAGVGCVLLLVFALRQSGLPLLSVYVDEGGAVFAGVLLGSAIGGLIGSRRGRDGDGSVRVAPVSAPRVRDYLAAREAWAARLLPAAAAVIAVVVVLEMGAKAFHIPGFPPMWSFFIPAVIAVIAALAFELVGRAAVAARVVAASEPSLALEAALRAVNLRALCLAPVLLGLIGTHIGVMRVIDSFGGTVPHRTVTVLLSGEFAAFGLALVLVLVYALRVPPRRLRIPRVAVRAA